MASLWVTVALLLGSAVVIYLSCEYFVNGVEWVGHKLAVGEKATGTVLAAFGTALPESVVTLVAVAFGGTAAAKDLGVGAALGGPLALATIAYATVGIMLLLSRRRLADTPAMRADLRGLSRDQGWFLAIFVVKIALGLVLFTLKPWLGILFLAAYALYVRQEMRADGDDDDAEGALEPLRFQPNAETPGTGIAIVQTLAALAVIFFASRLFVAQLEQLGPVLGLKPQLLALLLSPIATELPETMNAIIWVRQGKHRLALANISGAMMIQATIPTALGLFFTPWLLDRSLLLAAGVTALSIAVLFVAFRGGWISRALLASMGLLYLLFAGLLIALHLGR
ncbi:sodium:calcium antiporter [Sphingomonas sp. NFR15]|uniref:sodium:calcium antiporter n=1 Tax=Sphingomonas sp. NFR15 TaxID=1566282 RepID=UPI000884D1C1|nr:sodium:calcium antiporter [Sphingomonas sp. NFR15]SDA32401.1 cation:H+ antiporter [Sphingomonas sp. NFR15]